MEVPESSMELTPSVPEAAAPVAPSTETPAPPAPVEPAAPVTPAEPAAPTEPQLYDLPDGRKVDAETLQKEWKDNFLPDYTRKSQRLAVIDKGIDPNINNEPEWKKPDYVPKTYAEIIEIAEKQAIERLDARGAEEKARLETLTSEVNTAVADLKKDDPQLNENELFLHANKFGFRDLKLAYTNMKEMRNVALTTEQRVLKNLKTREADPVSPPSGATSPEEGFDPAEASQYSGALDFFRRGLSK